MHDMEWMSDLDEMRGLDVGEKYRNPKACAEFIDSTASGEQDSVFAAKKALLLAQVWMEQHSSLEQKSLFVRIMSQGVIVTRF